MISRSITVCAFSLFTTLLSACAVIPRDLDSYVLANGSSNHAELDANRFFIRGVVPNDHDKNVFSKLANLERAQHPLQDLNRPLISKGDLLSIRIHAMPDLNGVLKVNSAGVLELPYGGRLDVVGKSVEQVSAMMREQLVEMKWFNEVNISLTLSVVRFSSINVSVFGAVFNPGIVTINATPVVKPEQQIIQNYGASSEGRNLTSAISAAGGVRPDAMLSDVLLLRGDQLYSFNLSALISGTQYSQTPGLIDGDALFIKSRGEEHIELIRPSQVTPPGMRIQISNLTAPALSNALSAVGADATRLPYGSSLLDAAVSANCVGGTHQANASRSILLITRHHGSKQQLVVSRTINQLLANSSDYAVNAFLMPNDGVACYDSRFTNLRDVARGLGEVFGPILLGRLL